MEEHQDQGAAYEATRLRGLDLARDELDPDEFGRLLLLPDDAMSTALLRLERISAWLSSRRGRGGDLPKYAEGTGVGPDRFYRLARNFERTRSVAALGVAAPGGAHGRFVGRRSSRIEGERTRVEAAMKEVLSRRPDATAEELIAAARGLALERPPSLSALYKWAARLRADLATELFGSPLAAIVAVDAYLDEAVQHEISVVLDRGTALVLGAAVATGRGAYGALRSAMIDGAARVGEMRLAVASVAGRIRLDVATPADPSFSIIDVMRFLSEFEPSWRPVDPQEAVRLVRGRLGSGLGPLAIEPDLLPCRMELGEPRRSLLPSVDAADPAAHAADTQTPHPSVEAVGVEEFEHRLAEAVDEHNQPILQRLGGAREPARTRDMRERMSRVLATMRGEDA